MTQPETSSAPSTSVPPQQNQKAQQLPVPMAAAPAPGPVAPRVADPPAVRSCGCVVGVPREGITPSGLPSLTRDEVSWPASVRRGMSLAEEHSLRQQGCQLIQRLGESLKVPQMSTVATASAYFHVFYTRMCFQDHDWELMAMTALFLAGKVEDSRTPVKLVLSGFYKVRGIAVTDQELEAQKERVFKQELLLLEAIEYTFSVTHPYNHIKPIVKDLCARMPREWNEAHWKGNGALTQVVMFFMNDSLRTNACLVHSPVHVAVGCFFLAMAFKGVPQPLVPMNSPKSALVRPTSPSPSTSSSSSSSSSSSTWPPTAEGLWYEVLFGVTEAQILDIMVRLLSVLPAALQAKVPDLVRRAAECLPYPLLSLLPPSGQAVPIAPPPSSSPAQPRRRGQFPTTAVAQPAAPSPAPAAATETKVPMPSTPAPPSAASAGPVSTPNRPPNGPVPLPSAPTPSTATAKPPAPKTPAPKRPHAATGPSPSSTAATPSSAPAAPTPNSSSSSHQALPCPRCKKTLTKREYDAHRDECKRAFHQREKEKKEGKKVDEDDPFLGAGTDPKRHKTAHRSHESSSSKRPREHSSSSSKRTHSHASAASSSSAQVSATGAPSSSSSSSSAGPSRPAPNMVDDAPMPAAAPQMNGTHHVTTSTSAVASSVVATFEVKDVEMKPADSDSAAAPVVANGSHSTADDAATTTDTASSSSASVPVPTSVPAVSNKHSPQADPHPDVSLSGSQPRERDPDSDGADGGSASQKPIHSISVSVSVSHNDNSTAHSNGGSSSGSNGAGNSESVHETARDSTTAAERTVSSLSSSASAAAAATDEDHSGSPRSLKRRKAANGSATSLPLPLPLLNEDTKHGAPTHSVGRTDDWESSAPVTRDELSGMSPATRHLESDDSNMDSHLGSPTASSAPLHAFHSTDASAGTFFVPLNGDVNHAAAATRNEHFVHITSSPMVATNQN